MSILPYDQHVNQGCLRLNLVGSRARDINVQVGKLHDVPRCQRKILGLCRPGDQRVGKMQDATGSTRHGPKQGSLWLNRLMERGSST